MNQPRPKRTRLRARAKQISDIPHLSREKRADLQEALGHVFKEADLLDRALTHPSAVPGQRAKLSNQRLEFLGDRVLGLVIAESVYSKYEQEREGGLAPRLNALVSREACATVGERLSLSEYVLMDSSDRQQGGHEQPSVLADVVEALIGAIYLDGGLTAASRFVQRQWKTDLAGLRGRLKDAKSSLQEWAQGRGLPMPDYETLSRTGPDHSPEFKVEVRLESGEVAIGMGRTKQSAERAAATALLDELEVDQPNA